jgi:hypothetical protein
MPRWILLSLAATLACASLPESVPLVGNPMDVSSLVGEWTGEYDGGASGRSGSIVFVLRSAADTAHGDVLMIPRASGGERPTADARHGQLQLRSNQVLKIAFIRVASGQVSGTLDPYTDPDCNCSVQTTFTGQLMGNTIEGTFVTRGSQLPREQSGRWRVTRRQ